MVSPGRGRRRYFHSVRKLLNDETRRAWTRVQRSHLIHNGHVNRPAAILLQLVSPVLRARKRKYRGDTGLRLFLMLPRTHG
jgi:hypothetical protein